MASAFTKLCWRQAQGETAAAPRTVRAQHGTAAVFMTQHSAWHGYIPAALSGMWHGVQHNCAGIRSKARQQHHARLAGSIARQQRLWRSRAHGIGTILQR